MEPNIGNNIDLGTGKNGVLIREQLDLYSYFGWINNNPSWFEY